MERDIGPIAALYMYIPSLMLRAVVGQQGYKYTTALYSRRRFGFHDIIGYVTIKTAVASFL